MTMATRQIHSVIVVLLICVVIALVVPLGHCNIGEQQQDEASTTSIPANYENVQNGSFITICVRIHAVPWYYY